jgi:hypothetical protein
LRRPRNVQDFCHQEFRQSSVGARKGLAAHAPNIQCCDTTANSNIGGHNASAKSSGTRNTRAEISNEYYEKYVLYHDGKDTIQNVAEAIQGTLHKLPSSLRVVSLDIEWQVIRNARGAVMGKGKMDLLQLAFHTEIDGPVRVHIFNLNDVKQSVPRSVVSLLKDDKIVYIGCQVKGDLSKQPSRDFSRLVKGLPTPQKTQDISMMAGRQGISPKGSYFSEKSLCDAVLG